MHSKTSEPESGDRHRSASHASVFANCSQADFSISTLSQFPLLPPVHSIDQCSLAPTQAARFIGESSRLVHVRMQTPSIAIQFALQDVSLQFLSVATICACKPRDSWLPQPIIGRGTTIAHCSTADRHYKSHEYRDSKRSPVGFAGNRTLLSSPGGPVAGTRFGYRQTGRSKSTKKAVVNQALHALKASARFITAFREV